METTKVIIKNESKESVKVYLTLGAVVGAVEKVTNVSLVTNVVNEKQGWFMLESKESVSYMTPTGKAFNGNFAFNTPPINCPTIDFPSGVNLAEFMLNNGVLAGGQQETIDISGVAGTNAFIEFSMVGGGKWNAGSSKPNVTSFKNNHIGENAGLVGVYPYACDVCTASQNPPICSSKPAGAPDKITPQKEAICNVQRDASNSGGTVTITYKGDASLRPA